MATIIKKKHVKYACNSYVYYDPNYKDYKQGNIGLSEVMHNRVFVCVCLCVSTCVCVCACKCVWLCVLHARVHLHHSVPNDVSTHIEEKVEKNLDIQLLSF